MPRPRTAALPDTHWDPDRLARSRPRPTRAASRAERRSLHIPMRDGARIAVDVFLPAARDPGARLPAILRPTRYFRATAVRPPFHLLPVAELPDLYADARRRFLAAGYAWVDMDVRGSGASSGRQAYPWWTEEVRDEGEVVDWIVAQPWSSGRVGALGVSYDGTASELLLTCGHPAVRAVAPLFSLFDVYADVAFPGGVHLERFTEAWGWFNAALDRNDNPGAMALALWLTLRSASVPVPERGFRGAASAVLRAMLAGVRPVDEDRDGALLAAAIAEHAVNLDVHAGAKRVRARDDGGLMEESPEETIDACSPHRHAADLRASGAAVYGVSGWRDGAYQHSAVKRFRTVTTPGSRMLLGPLCHGGKLYVSPGRPTRATGFDLDGELLRFFDLHLHDRDDGIGAEAPVRYYTTGEEAWKSASSWPPPGTRPRALYLSAGRALAWERPDREDADEYRVDPATGTGERSRWRGLLSPLVRSDYADWHPRGARLLTYTSAPLAADLTVTGHPLVTLYFASTGDDATIFAYLEEVEADGTVHYLTEGQLRASHRAIAEEAPYASAVPYHSCRRGDAAALPRGEVVEIVLDLLPLSHRLRRGSSIRLALGGADRDHFEAPPDAGARWRVHRGAGRASRIELPVVG